jgi:hypothetical protein
MRRHYLLLLAMVAGACGTQDQSTPLSSGTPLASIDSVLTIAGRRVPPALLNRYVAEQEGFTSRGGRMRCAYVPLAVADDRVFLNTLCLELVHDGDSLTVGSGRGSAIALRIGVQGDSVRVISHETPGDGNRHMPDIRRIFPPDVVERILEPVHANNARVGMLEAYLRGDAAVRLGLRPRDVRSRLDSVREERRRGPGGAGAR